MRSRPARAGLYGLVLIVCAAARVIAADIDYAMQLPRAQFSLLLDIARAGHNVVAVGERGHILVSTDEGGSWQQVQVPVSSMLTRVFFIDDRQGWAVGHDGNVLHSEDSGLSWSLQRDGLADQVHINEVRAGRARTRVESLQAMLAALPESEGGELRDALDEALWQLDNALAVMDRPVYAPPLMDVWFTTPEQGWAAGAYGTLLYTATGGRHWEDWSHKVDNPEELHFNGVSGDGHGRLYLASEWGNVFRSDNGGEDWLPQETGYDGSFFGVISPPDSADVFAYGLRGTIYRAREGSTVWQALDSGVTASLFGATARGKTLIFVGRAGTATVTRDGGDSFRPLIQSQRDGLFGIVAVAEDRFIATGEGGSRSLEWPAQGADTP